MSLEEIDGPRLSALRLDFDVVLLDVWASWCGPCKAVVQHLEAAAEILGGSAKVVKLNVGVHTSLAAELNVSSLPTFILYKGGKEVKRTSSVFRAPGAVVNFVLGDPE